MSSIFSTQNRQTFFRRKYCFLVVATALSPPVGRCDALTGRPPFEGSNALERVKKMSGLASPDPYTSQVYDHTNMVLMAMALAKATTGTAIKDNIRGVTQGGGKAVDNAVDGLKAIAAGEKIDYAGASGPCDFDEKGDILDCKFRYDQIKAGKPVLVKVA